MEQAGVVKGMLPQYVANSAFDNGILVYAMLQSKNDLGCLQSVN